MPQVTIISNTVGAEIRYSTDNSDVTEQSTLYSGQFSVEAGTTVKAKAFKSGMNPSPQSTLQSLPKLQTPTISLTRSGSTINITIGNTVEGATYRYKVGSAPTSASDGTAITSTGSVTNSSAVTIYVAGWYTGQYNPSDAGSDSVSQYTPTLQTPTLSLSRSGSTVNGTIGNTVSGATYVYKVGSTPTSQSDGTVISGTSFSFSNDDAVTVYVRGYKEGYTPSNAVSDSITQYIKPYPDEWSHYLGNMNGSETNVNMIDMAYSPNSNVYVGIGEGRYVYYSYDLTNWTRVDLQSVDASVEDLCGIIFVAPYFHVYGYNGIILSSINGINWSKELNTDAFGTSNIKTMIYANGRYIITGNNKVAWLEAGNTFTLGNSPASNARPRAGVMAYLKGYYYITDNYDDRLYRTPNGQSWTTYNMNELLDISVTGETFIYSLAASDDIMIATMSTPDGVRIAYTSDGVNWTISSDGDTNNPYNYAVDYGNGIFIAMSKTRLGLGTPLDIIYTDNGSSWSVIEQIDYNDGDIEFVRYANGKFVGMGDSFFTVVADF